MKIKRKNVMQKSELKWISYKSRCVICLWYTFIKRNISLLINCDINFNLKYNTNSKKNPSLNIFNYKANSIEKKISITKINSIVIIKYYYKISVFMITLFPRTVVPGNCVKSWDSQQAINFFPGEIYGKNFLRVNYK